jgi:hypothetical protein
VNAGDSGLGAAKASDLCVVSAPDEQEVAAAQAHGQGHY